MCQKKIGGNVKSWYDFFLFKMASKMAAENAKTPIIKVGPLNMANMYIFTKGLITISQ